MKTKKYFLITALLLAVFLVMQSIPIDADTMQQINYTIASQGKSVSPNFAVSVLKYDPFPVNAGDSFDLWIKVQNIGQQDAPNAIFELFPDYPFSSNDVLVRNYGRVYGTVNAYTINANGDASQVILKYRVKVEDNAPSGSSNLKFVMKTDTNDLSSVSVNFPIEIAKTKTDFDVRLNDVTPQETTFIVTNIGNNDARAVTLNIKSQSDITFLRQSEPSVLGDIPKGEFITSHIQAIPKTSAKSITVEISYTDTVGARTTIEKIISLDQISLQNVCVQSSNNDYMNWAYGIVGFLAGIFLIIILGLIRQKKRASKHSK